MLDIMRRGGKKKKVKRLRLGYCSLPPSFSKVRRVSAFISLNSHRLTCERSSCRPPTKFLTQTARKETPRGGRDRDWQRRGESAEHIGENIENWENRRFKLQGGDADAEDVWGGGEELKNERRKKYVAQEKVARVPLVQQDNIKLMILFENLL